MVRLNSKEAKTYLGDIEDPSKQFWVYEGPALKNLNELLKAVKTMPVGIFKHHVAPENNDFTNWINDVIGDKKLANDLKKANTKKSTIEKLKKRIQSLKKIAK